MDVDVEAEADADVDADVDVRCVDVLQMCKMCLYSARQPTVQRCRAHSRACRGGTQRGRLAHPRAIKRGHGRDPEFRVQS